MAMCSGIASAQEQHVSNFEGCVTQAKEKRGETTTEIYSSWKCDGATAQRLAARPDQCSADVKPSLRNVERRTRQLDDGFYTRVVWATDLCAGQCEMRSYNDARETSYLCEVRRHADVRPPRYGGPPLRNTYNRRYRDDYPPGRYGDDYRPGPAQRRDYYGPALRGYEPPPPYVLRRRPEPERESRMTERWVYVTPGWHLEYRYDDYPDDRRRDNYRDDDRRDDYRREDYRPPRIEYRPGEYRREDYRPGDDR
jgi:hypothetical protein